MKKPDRNQLICSIDMTGFVSIQIAILFVFIMPSAFPPGQRSFYADPPRAKNTVSLQRADREDAMIVAVVRDGKVYFNSEAMWAYDQLRTRLQDSVRQGAEKRLYIEADRRVRYEAVVQVLDQARKAGIENVAFLTHKTSE